MANRNTRIRGVQVLYNTIDENHLTASVAGDGLAGGNGTALSLDLNELTGAVVDVANDSIAIVDANDSNASRKEAVADVITAVAGVLTLIILTVIGLTPPYVALLLFIGIAFMALIAKFVTASSGSGGS